MGWGEEGIGGPSLGFCVTGWMDGWSGWGDVDGEGRTCD